MKLYDFETGKVIEDNDNNDTSDISVGRELLDLLPDSLRGRLALAGAVGITAVGAVLVGGGPTHQQAREIRQDENAQLAHMYGTTAPVSPDSSTSH